jgi:hypothetical protein
MIYIELSSRIGNHLFQIAAGASLASRLGCSFAAFPRHQMLTEPDHCLIPEYLQQFRNNILRRVAIIEELPLGLEVYEEPAFHFQPISVTPPVLLRGYFQSFKYFDESLVRTLFAIDEDSRQQISTRYPFLLTENYTSITVRRGDYLRFANILPVCSLRYFRNAMKHIPEGNKFLIISDDIDWCRKKFRGPQFAFVDDEPPLIDLYLQTFCQNNIISNSTFAWWGAWLNPAKDKIVVYPKRWFGAFKTADTRDLFPENWISVDNPTAFTVKVRAYQLELFKRIRRKWAQWIRGEA